MKKIIFILCCLFFCFAKCKTKKNCHRTAKIRNDSGQSIIYAFLYHSVSDNSKCSLDGTEIKPGETYEWRQGKDCLENVYDNANWEFYLINPNQFVNEKYKEYACDSIPIKNLVLKHYVLTLDDLKNTNFTIAYP